MDTVRKQMIEMVIDNTENPDVNIIQSAGYYELNLEKKIREAEEWVADGELEMDHFTPEMGSGKAGWYACKYIEGYGSTLIEKNSYNKAPLISDENIEKYGVDVYKIFDRCNVLYCG